MPDEFYEREMKDKFGDDILDREIECVAWDLIGCYSELLDTTHLAYFPNGKQAWIAANPAKSRKERDTVRLERLVVVGGLRQIDHYVDADQRMILKPIRKEMIAAAGGLLNAEEVEDERRRDHGYLKLNQDVSGEWTAIFERGSFLIMPDQKVKAQRTSQSAAAIVAFIRARLTENNSIGGTSTLEAYIVSYRPGEALVSAPIYIIVRNDAATGG